MIKKLKRWVYLLFRSSTQMELDNKMEESKTSSVPLSELEAVVVPIVNAVFTVLIKIAPEGRIKSGLVGLDALMDVWLPNFLASLGTLDQLTLTAVVKSLLSFLQSVTAGEPVLHGILVAIGWILPYLLPKLKAEMKLKGVNPAIDD